MLYFKIIYDKNPINVGYETGLGITTTSANPSIKSPDKSQITSPIKSSRKSSDFEDRNPTFETRDFIDTTRGGIHSRVPPVKHSRGDLEPTSP